MASIYIEEYATIVEDLQGNEAQIPGSPLGTNATEKVTIGATTARSTADFNAKTTFLVISADADCQFEVGDGTVTADGNSRILYSGTYREVYVGGGDTRIAVIEKQ